MKNFFARQISFGRIIALVLLLGIPYGVVGLIWLSTHSDHLASVGGLDLAFSAVGEIIAWPALLVSDLTLK